jgi:hypothetical protein
MIIMLSLLLSSCAWSYKKLYEGKRLTINEIARVYAETVPIYPNYIDGKFHQYAFGATNRFDLLPGDHVITMIYLATSSVPSTAYVAGSSTTYTGGELTKTVTVEAGHRYRIQGLYQGKTWNWQMRDENTNEIVSSN